MEIQIEMEEARRRWSFLVHQVVTRGVRVVLLREGRIVGALVGRSDFDFLMRHKPGFVATTGPPN
jgi:hypothetical protein